MDEPVRPPQGPKPTKAYHDMRFLNSSDARVVRILSEYLEPASRLRWQRVHDTIVFFGSARAELNTKLAHYYDHAAELARLVTTWTRTLHGDLKRLMVCSVEARGSWRRPIGVRKRLGDSPSAYP